MPRTDGDKIAAAIAELRRSVEALTKEIAKTGQTIKPQFQVAHNNYGGFSFEAPPTSKPVVTVDDYGFIYDAHGGNVGRIENDVIYLSRTLNIDEFNQVATMIKNRKTASYKENTDDQ